MIITQQRLKRPPKAKHLMGLYWQCRRTAELLQVQTWTHQYRRHNKMADTLANEAMDTRKSVQATVVQAARWRTTWDLLEVLAEGDVSHWQTTQHDEDFSESVAFTL
eukprot:jgi/Phyca11/103555/e_gw1.8.910.1